MLFSHAPGPTLLVAAGGLLIVPAVLLAAEGAAAFKPDRVTVTSLTADPLISESETDSLFRALLSRPEVEQLLPRRGLASPGITRRPNLLGSTGGDSAAVPVDIELELEVSDYGPWLDPRQDIATFWAFGLLGTMLSSDDVVSARIQWRATLAWAGLDKPVTVVATGIVTGDATRLGRRDALAVANRRALWNLTYAIVEAVAKHAGIRQKLSHAREMERDYYDRVDAR